VGGPSSGGETWGEEYRQLAALDAEQGLNVDDLDRLATAAYMTGRDEESFELWGRGHHRCLEMGDTARAIRFGVRLAQALAFKGDIARSSGWVERSHRLLDDANLDCVERGFLEHAAGMCRIFADGDITAAYAAFGRAAKIGEQFRDRELLTFVRVAEGRCLIYLGEIAEGLGLLDEAMVSVEAREIPPMAVGDAYCTVIDACYELFDLRRCEQWTDSFTQWCDTQSGLVLYRGHCLLHRAELLMLHGAWSDALTVVRDACARLAEPINPLTLGGAHYVEADLHRLRGEFTLAEDAYERANGLGCQPQPGMALLRLAQGRVDVAANQSSDACSPKPTRPSAGPESCVPRPRSSSPQWMSTEHAPPPTSCRLSQPNSGHRSCGRTPHSRRVRCCSPSATRPPHSWPCAAPPEAGASWLRHMKGHEHAC
jgi:hypothetical protein